MARKIREKKPKRDQPLKTPVKKVSILSNAGQFGLNFAHIIDVDNRYRLIVHDHKEKFLFDRKYKTPVNATIGFLKYFGEKYASESPKPEWSEFFTPLQRWWDKKSQFVESFPMVFKTRGQKK